MMVQKKYNTTLLFISQDLSVVRYLADYVVVMHLGQIREAGTADEIFSPPYHPYTSLLLHSVPEMRPGWLEEIRETETAQLAAASVVEIGATGCPFHKRCPLAIKGVCDTQPPPVRPLPNGHQIACHREIAELGH